MSPENRTIPPGRPSAPDLFVTHRAALVDYATPILGCRASAEDVVQDAYLRFRTATERTQDDGASIAHPVAYLYRTVRNLALNWLRRRGTEAPAPDQTVLETLVAPTPTPEHQTLYREELRRVEQAMAELPERTRRAFELHRLGGYTLQQVADTLGISVGLTHQLVRSAMTFCADRLDDDI